MIKKSSFFQATTLSDHNTYFQTFSGAVQQRGVKSFDDEAVLPIALPAWGHCGCRATQELV